jgi:hypothetical protein
MILSTVQFTRRSLIAAILLLTTTVGSASAQCAATCLLMYGRFTVSDGEIYWYSSCTTTFIGGHTYINCYYESDYWILPPP